VINIANLKSIHFAAILSGAKRTEWRWRIRPDATLSAIERGEKVLLLEIGSHRAIRATVRAVVRFDYPYGHLYAIRLLAPRLAHEPHSERRIQGWIRR
jgi:hypothetical protein